LTETRGAEIRRGKEQKEKTKTKWEVKVGWSEARGKSSKKRR
jgi:hypothetical protein